MVDTPNASQNTNADDPEYRSVDESLEHREEEHVPSSPSKFSDHDIRVLDVTLGSPHHDQAQHRILKSAFNVARD